MKTAYNIGDCGYPCTTPRSAAKAGDRAGPRHTLLDADEYIPDRTARAEHVML